MKRDDSIYTDSTTRRSPYTLYGPMIPRPRPIAWQQVVYTLGWWAGLAAIVAALLKLGGGW